MLIVAESIFLEHRQLSAECFFVVKNRFSIAVQSYENLAEMANRESAKIVCDFRFWTTLALGKIIKILKISIKNYRFGKLCLP
jgi:hypothetical protein